MGNHAYPKGLIAAADTLRDAAMSALWAYTLDDLKASPTMQRLDEAAARYDRVKAAQDKKRHG